MSHSIQDGKKTIAAVRNYKTRILQAKSQLPDGIGQQDVILAVIRLAPELDSLACATRWRNAWFAKVSDPTITELVEKVVADFIESNAKKKPITRLKRQNLKAV